MKGIVTGVKLDYLYFMPMSLCIYFTCLYRSVSIGLTFPYAQLCCSFIAWETVTQSTQWKECHNYQINIHYVSLIINRQVTIDLHQH